MVVLVVGAGVIGLAIARALRHKEVILVERCAAIGQGTSSRNSEVLHAGLYYPRGSLKHLSSVEGRAMMLEYMNEKNIPYNLCGKIIVGDNDQALREIATKAHANGVPVTKLSPKEVRRLEPVLREGLYGLFSPNTGVIDSHQLMMHLLYDVEHDSERMRNIVSLNTEVISGEVHPSHVSVHTSNGDIEVDTVINAAGLDAPRVARACGVTNIPQAWLCRGRYWKCKRAPFTHLIYPLPEKNTAGLGIHATIAK